MTELPNTYYGRHRPMKAQVKGYIHPKGGVGPPCSTPFRALSIHHPGGHPEPHICRRKVVRSAFFGEFHRQPGPQGGETRFPVYHRGFGFTRNRHRTVKFRMSQNDHFRAPERHPKGPKRLKQQPAGSIQVLGAIIDPTDHRSDHFDCGVRRSRPLFDWYLAWVEGQKCGNSASWIGKPRDIRSIPHLRGPVVLIDVERLMSTAEQDKNWDTKKITKKLIALVGTPTQDPQCESVLRRGSGQGFK